MRDRVAFRCVVRASGEFNEVYLAHLTALQIPVSWVKTGCPHDLKRMLEKRGMDSFAFIAGHLEESPR